MHRSTLLAQTGPCHTCRPRTGVPIVGVPSTVLDPNARAPNLTYHVDSTVHVKQAQAQAIAATILPAAVHAISNGFSAPTRGSKGANTYT